MSQNPGSCFQEFLAVPAGRVRGRGKGFEPEGSAAPALMGGTTLEAADALVVATAAVDDALGETGVSAAADTKGRAGPAGLPRPSQMKPATRAVVRQTPPASKTLSRRLAAPESWPDSLTVKVDGKILAVAPKVDTAVTPDFPFTVGSECLLQLSTES